MSSMASKRDYYEVLGVAQTASADEIRKAFRRLARQHHPDVNQGSRDSEEAFKELKEAYDVLSDPERRGRYDQYGHDAPSAGGVNVGDFGVDIFDMFFGGGRRTGSRRSGPVPGEDLRYDLEMTLEEAATGVHKTFSIAREQSCEECSGTGSRGASTPAPCSACGGAGQVRRTQQTILGSFSAVSTCPRCQGEGTVVTDPCAECQGRGRRRVQAEISVDIPPGVETGTVLRMSHEGDRGRRGGPPGDLDIVIHVAAHDRFQRRGVDLIVELDVSFPQAALGSSLSVPTLDGSTELQVPAGTQPGQVFRIRGAGMPDLNGRGKGDLHAVVRIPVPEKLTDRQRQAIEELAAAFDEKLAHSKSESHGLRGLLDRAKEVFDLEK
ncbi:MAG: molecular chaperone DnaJ [Chloroflexi bacterium]|nr:molecular chaperone DnaJ [Chloroflexota bacterium]